MASGDITCAEAIFAEGAAQRDPECEYQLGRLHVFRLAESPDLFFGVGLIQRAAIVGHPNALAQLTTWACAGQLFGCGARTEIDWMRLGFNAGATGCILQAVTEVLRSSQFQGVPPNLSEELFAQLQRTAAQGAETALALLAYYLRVSVGGHQNAKKASDIIDFLFARGIVIPSSLWGMVERAETEPLATEVGVPATLIGPTADGLIVRHAISVISKPEALYLAVHVGRKLRPSLTASVAGVRRTSGYRTSDDYCLDPLEEDPVLAKIQFRIAAAFGRTVLFAEPLTVMRYRPGQRYRLHTDLLPFDEINSDHQINFGQRTDTHISYLNNDYTGGQTEFPSISFRYQGLAGNVLCFNSTSGSRHLLKSAHRGCVVTSGEKWIATLWMREQQCRPAYELR